MLPRERGWTDDPKQFLCSPGFISCFQSCTCSPFALLVFGCVCLLLGSPERPGLSAESLFGQGFPSAELFGPPKCRARVRPQARASRQELRIREVRAEVMGGQWGHHCHSRVPLFSAGSVSHGVQTHGPSWGRAPLRSLPLSPSLEFPWIPHKSLSGWKPFLQERWRWERRSLCHARHPMGM